MPGAIAVFRLYVLGSTPQEQMFGIAFPAGKLTHR
jgi:hypothetical protein